MMSRFTHWVLSHRLVVVLAWLVVAIVGAASSSASVGALDQHFTLPGREGYETNQHIVRLFGNGGSTHPLVPVISLPMSETVDSPRIQRELRAAFDRAKGALPHARVVSFASTGSRVFVSHDGRTTFGLVYFPPPETPDGLVTAQHALSSALAATTVGGAHFHVTGLDALASGSGTKNGPDVLVETLLGAIGALLILAFVFRSFMALVPLMMAAVAIPTTFLLLWGVTTVTTINYIVEFLVALIGLGVSMDYALVVIVRWREERARGLENTAAVQRAMETAGRAVVLSGTTVAIGLLALVVLPVPFVRSMGYGGLLIPLVSVAVALTLLPAVLSSVGPHLDWPRSNSSGTPGTFWPAWARLVIRRRWFAVSLGSLVLGLLLLAAQSLSLGQPKANALSKAGSAHVGLVALERAGIASGVMSPFEVKVRGSNPALIAENLARVPGIRGAVAPNDAGWRQGHTALVAVLPTIDLSSSAGRDTLGRLRGVAPGSTGAVTVGGAPALDSDFIDALYSGFPMMVVLIALATFLLLVRAFGSLVLPLKAVLLNLLSLGASLGILTLVWQDGYGSKAIWGIQSTGSITFWIPMLIFAFLYGLSMDYEVFILCRMREEFDSTGSTDAAVIAGIGRTGRLVTSAALILFFAFLALSAGPQTEIKVLGTGLGAGILLDATVIRMLLLPSIVSLMGGWNWWLPPMSKRVLEAGAVLAPVEVVETDR